MDDWQPIETAPRDGKDILVLVPCFGRYSHRGQLRGYLHFVASWCKPNEGEGFWMTGYGRKTPVLWTDLKDPPNLESVQV